MDAKTRLKINEQIQLAMGWTKQPADKNICGFEGGWWWVSPEGHRYEGNNLMIRDHLAHIEAAAKVLPAVLRVLADRPNDQVDAHENQTEKQP